MMECCLAVDIGASSGRVMAGWIKGGQIQLVEVHRFANEMIQKGNHFCWDVAYLFAEIKKAFNYVGRKDCAQRALASIRGRSILCS